VVVTVGRRARDQRGILTDWTVSLPAATVVSVARGVSVIGEVSGPIVTGLLPATIVVSVGKAIVVGVVSVVP